MNSPVLPANVHEGLDIHIELELVRQMLENQSQATLQLARRVATLGTKAERLSAKAAVTLQFDQMVLPSTAQLPQVDNDFDISEHIGDETRQVQAPDCKHPLRQCRFKEPPLRQCRFQEPEEDKEMIRDIPLRNCLFKDTDEVQETIRHILRDKPYSVTDYYKETGVFQAVARSHIFEIASLTIVIASSMWMAVDIDLNHAVMLHQADIGFQVVGNTVCFFFTVELIIRMLAFKKKRDIFKDFWCVFDLLLVTIIVLETWVLWFLIAACGLEIAGSNIRILGVVRMMRLVRILRLAKLFRFMPELLIIIQSVGIAMRAISLVFVLVMMIIYMGAIAFRVLLENTPMGKERFETVTQAMGTLLLDCAMSGTKGGPLIREAYQEHPIYALIMFCFALLANVTMMGVIGGLLVQTIKKVAEVEENEKKNMNNLAIMEDFWSHLVVLDQDNDGYISREELFNLISQPQTLKILKKMDVDPEILVSLSDFIFEENKGRMSQKAFNEWVCDLRGTQKCTVKDHYETRKFIMEKLNDIFAAAPQANKLDLLKGSYL